MVAVVRGEFAKPLILTTPHMRGKRVRDAQWLLQGHTALEGLAPYKDGPLDSDYGPVTAKAAARAKFWCGYPDSGIDERFGQQLYDLLTGKTKLPAAYAERRRGRLEAAVRTPGEKAYDLAVTQVGYKESWRNRTKYGRWFGFDGVAWCAIFESWCFGHTGYPSFRTASVEEIYWSAVGGRHGLRIVHTPQRGDVVCYDLHGTQFTHTAFFSHWTGRSTFVDLGGNTGPTNISNGGMVAYGNRSMFQVRAFVRVG